MLVDDEPSVVHSLTRLLEGNGYNVVSVGSGTQCLEKLEKYEEAIEWYEKASRIDPDFSEAWYGIAICYLFRKLYNDALYYVNKAISLDEENPDFWFTLGNIHAHLNSPADAVKSYARTTLIDCID